MTISTSINNKRTYPYINDNCLYILIYRIMIFILISVLFNLTMPPERCQEKYFIYQKISLKLYTVDTAAGGSLPAAKAFPNKIGTIMEETIISKITGAKYSA